jgi:hypothetical protein
MTLDYAALADLCDRRLGTRDVACPFCGPDRRSHLNRKRGVLRIWHQEPGFATYACARCGEKGYARDGIEPRRWPRTAEARCPGTILPPRSDDKQRNFDFAMELWQQSVPLQDTLGWRYFIERRGLNLHAASLALGHALRWNESVSAIVALMTDAVTGASIGIHRTFLNVDGTKRDRKMLGKQGVIRLSPDPEVTMGLGLVEGIEDGLAVLLSGWGPVWAATSAGAIERFPRPLRYRRSNHFCRHRRDRNESSMRLCRSMA